jgi:hypothetical protein
MADASFKSIFKPENSIISGVAVAGSVLAIYNLGVGTLSQAHASDANHMSLESARKKSAYSAFLFVSAVTLLAKDVNIGILGFGTIIAMELTYRHSIMTNPSTGKMEAPAISAQAPVTPPNVINMPQTSDYGYGS